MEQRPPPGSPASPRAPHRSPRLFANFTASSLLAGAPAHLPCARVGFLAPASQPPPAPAKHMELPSSHSCGNRLLACVLVALDRLFPPCVKSLPLPGKPYMSFYGSHFTSTRKHS